MSFYKVSFAAGGGKTTEAEKYLREHTGGLYLAFNKKVVSDLELKGFLSKTFDSLFQNYIIPKCISFLPCISKTSSIQYIDDNVKQKQNIFKGVCSLSIDDDGNILYRKNKTGAKLSDSNFSIKVRFNNNQKYFSLIHAAFGYKKTMITDELRKGIMIFLLKKHKQKVVELIKRRFNFVIIDEAQDIKNHIELFTKALINSDYNVILFGDSNQNINQGSTYFEELKSNEVKNESFRCSESVCSVIRKKIGIEIYGTSDHGVFRKINLEDVLSYNDGNRVLLYKAHAPYNLHIIKEWVGESYTIQEAKGMTICKEIVIIAKKLNKKFLYTAITRGKSNVFSTIDEPNE